MKTQKPHLSGYLSYPSWVPTQEDPRRHVDWPSGLFYTAEHVCGKVEEVGVVPEGRSVAFVGWRVTSEVYRFRTRSSHHEDWQEFTFKRGDILCRAIGNGTTIEVIVPPNPLKWRWTI